MNIIHGSDCLQYIDRDIAIVSRFLNKSYQDFNSDLSRGANPFGFKIKPDNTGQCLAFDCSYDFGLVRFENDKSKRIVGLVVDEYDDGGLKVKVLSNEQYFSLSTYKGLTEMCSVTGRAEYVLKSPLGDELVKKSGYNLFPEISNVYPDPNSSTCILESNGRLVPYDSMVAFEPAVNFELNNAFNHERISGNRVTRDINNTLLIGDGIATIGFNMIEDVVKDPLSISGGDIYSWCVNKNIIGHGSMPGEFQNSTAFLNFEFELADVPCVTTNFVTIPYNIILTRSEQQAFSYLDSGVVPADAFLYPLDWQQFPQYITPDDDGDDGTDNNTPDDDIRDVTPNLPVIPTFVPQMLTNNNYYWLTAPELESFLLWYWNDVGNIQDIDDLLAKIEGLYNNLSQAILNIRFMPVDVSWIGGTGQRSNIKIAQIEKNGAVDTLSKTGKPSVEPIGDIHIPNKYNSFVDMSPYSQLSLYLPYHGFLDLDINIFSGHDIYVKAIYDYMSGTIQYLIYYDNQFLVNTIVCKMAMDIPISLQTKNDRDSAVFQNVSNVVGGLMGAGLSIGTGNPMGLLVGANALNSGVASAPLNVKGNVGEQGAFYAPPQCAIILRRPTISKPSQDIWKSKVGQICGKSYTLANLSGYTTVYNPQITFNGNKNADGVTIKPLQSEVEEIYSALEKGVII